MAQAWSARPVLNEQTAQMGDYIAVATSPHPKWLASGPTSLYGGK